MAAPTQQECLVVQWQQPAGNCAGARADMAGCQCHDSGKPHTTEGFSASADAAVAAGHNVLVAAHTSAGKTVVAEYAFAMGLR